MNAAWSAASLIRVVLGFVRFFVALALAAAVITTLALAFIPAPKVTVTVPVSFHLDSAGPLRGRPGFGFEILNQAQLDERNREPRVDTVDGALRIPSTSKRFIAANAVAFISILAFTAFVLDKLRAVLLTLSHGNPFVPANATRIRQVGFAVIIGELVRTVIVYAENSYAAAHVAIAGLQFDTWPRVSFITIGCGLIVLVIAEVFRAGTRLDEEQSLTI